MGFMKKNMCLSGCVLIGCHTHSALNVLLTICYIIGCFALVPGEYVCVGQAHMFFHIPFAGFSQAFAYIRSSIHKTNRHGIL